MIAPDEEGGHTSTALGRFSKVLWETLFAWPERRAEKTHPLFIRGYIAGLKDGRSFRPQLYDGELRAIIRKVRP